MPFSTSWPSPTRWASRSIDEFDTIAARTLIVADMTPGGRYTASDLYDAGGISLVMRELLKRDLIDGAQKTVDGRTIARIAEAATETPGQQVVLPIETPLKETGGLAILHGSLAPEGCVVKLAGHERTEHRGPARVFDSETACFDAVRAGRIARRRGGHPLRGTKSAARACRRCSGSPRRSWARAWGESVALLTDGRFSGGTRGLMIGHVAPGGGARRPHRAGRGRWRISIDVAARRLDLGRRRGPRRTAGGVAATGAALRRWRHGQVRGARLSASEGAVTMGRRMAASARTSETVSVVPEPSPITGG